jgi:hypothetical protein
MVDVDQEPVAIRVTRYRCPFCLKSASRKTGIRPHIEFCWGNPAKRGCGTCKHYDEGYPDTYTEPGEPACCEKGLPMTVEYRNEDGEPRTHSVSQCPGWEAS